MRQRLPYLLLLGLIVLHVALAAAYLRARQYTPVPSHHSGYRLVHDLRRQLQGHPPVDRRERIMLGTRATFVSARQGSLLRPDRFVRELASGSLRGAWRNDRDVTYWNQIPHAYLTPAIVGAAFAGSPYPLLLAPQLYLALLLVALFGLGSRAGGPWVGLASAAVASGYPAVFGLARTYHDGLAVGALATATVWLLLSSDGLRRPGYAAAAGAAGWLTTRAGESIGMSALAALIVVGPALAVVFDAVRGGLRERSTILRRLLGLALALAPTLALTEWFRVQELLWNVRSSGGDADTLAKSASGADASRALAFGAYGHQIAVSLARPVMTLWALVGALLLWRAPRGQRLATLVMFAVPFVLLSWTPRKAAWYAMPIVPSLALITALGLQGLPRRRLRIGASAAAAGCGVVAMLVLTLAPEAARKQFDIERLVPGIRGLVSIPAFAVDEPWNHISIQHRTAAGEFVQTLAAARPPGGDPPRPLVVGVVGAREERWLLFRCAVEAVRDDVLVVDLLGASLRRTGYQGLMAERFDVLVVEDGRIPGRMGVLEHRDERALASGRAGAPGGHRGGDLPAFVRHLLARPWTRVDSGRGPLYLAP